MIALHVPRDEAELIAVRALLDGAGIDFYVRNEHFGGLQLGPLVPGYNARAVMVHEADLAIARDVLAPFLAAQARAPLAPAAAPLRHRLRMVAEALLFGWFVPSRGRRRKAEPKLRVVEPPPDRER